MITWGDLYTVLSAVVPLYVAMILAYGSVKWWSIFTRDQCAGINRFVAVFAVPLLSFQFISGNNIYAMNYRFIAADSLQKVVILVVLGLWAKLGKSGSLDWMITLFSLSTLPNTLVMGIPLLKAMYGGESGSLMVQVVVMQSVIWYTLMLFLFEFRGAKMLIMEQFPAHGHDIVSFRVDSDVVSLDGRDPLHADAEVGDDGKIHVTVRKSTSSRSVRSRSAGGLASVPSPTPRPSNMTGVEIYSLQSSRNPTPRGSSFNHTDFYSMVNRNLSPLHSNFQPPEIYSRGVTPRTSNYEDDSNKAQRWPGAVQKHLGRSISGGLSAPDAAVPYPVPNTGMGMLSPTHNNNNHMVALKKSGSHGVEGMARSPHGHYQQQPQRPGDGKELHMFVWSSSASPVSEANHMFGVNHDLKDARPIHPTDNSSKGYHESSASYDEFSHIKKGSEDYGGGRDVEMSSPVNSKLGQAEYGKDGSVIAIQEQASSMPPASVMTRLILIMVWRKLIRNPNTYSSALGLIWSLVSFRFNIEMPKIIHGSISILSDAGLGMAMVSLGLFMALQPKIIACGKSVAAFAMAVRFLTGPAVMAASSIAIGLRGPLLHLAIVQAALPQGIVPFVFAKEYNVHPEILSTAVIFGMLIALPITLLYYIFLGL